MEIGAFWNQVDQEIGKFDLLQHPFYRAWSAGGLTARERKIQTTQRFAAAI